ncbi:MAG: leucine-rich repeat protein [Spirochaetaceae bacterium]|nr:leucine-rich repeat protein [Spirochaetaceae bacterium]
MAEEFEIECGVLKRYNGTDSAVTIPEGVTVIGVGAFSHSNCESLTSVTIPGGVWYIGMVAFLDCTLLEEIRYDGTKEQWKAAKKGVGWNACVPAEYVVCTDGTVKLSLELS